MNAYIIKKDTREVVVIVENVQKINDDSVVGVDSTCKGIDFGIADCVVTDVEFHLGENISELVEDKRGLLPKTEVEMLQDQVAQLQTQIQALTNP